MDNRHMSFPLLRLPPEIIVPIIQWSGWSLPLRLSCKTIANMYKGIEYEKDTCVPRFYHRWNEVTRCPLPGFPKSLQQSEEKKPEDIVTHPPTPMHWHLDEDEEPYFSYSLMPDKPFFALVDFKIHGNISDIESIDLFISHIPHGMKRFVLRDFIQYIVPNADGSISPFPSLLPMLLQPPRHLWLAIYPRERFSNNSFSISWTSGCYRKWLQPKWQRGEKMTLYRHFLGKYSIPHMIQGWVLKVPPEHLPHITRLNFYIHETTEHETLIQLPMTLLGKHHADFPYPLDPSRYIVIPLNKAPIPHLHNGYMEGVEVWYEMSCKMNPYQIHDTDIYHFISYALEYWTYGNNSMGVYVDYNSFL